MDFAEIAQEVILDHCRHPRNYGELTDATWRRDGANPECGDEITLYGRVRRDRLEGISFLGSGCAICLASASLMTQKLGGLTLEEAGSLRSGFQELLTAEEAASNPLLGELQVLRGVRDYPLRVKCAMLAWRILGQALTAGPTN